MFSRLVYFFDYFSRMHICCTLLEMLYLTLLVVYARGILAPFTGEPLDQIPMANRIEIATSQVVAASSSFHIHVNHKTLPSIPKTRVIICCQAGHKYRARNSFQISNQ